MNFGDLRKWVTGVKGEKAQLIEAIEAKKRRREDLVALPICKADYIAICERWVERKGADFAANRLKSTTANIIRTPLSRHPDEDRPDVLDRLQLLVAPAGDGWNGTTSLAAIESGLCFMFGEQLKAGYRRAAAQMGLVDGPTIAERRAEIAKLDREIGEIEKQLEALVAEARGIISDL